MTPRRAWVLIGALAACGSSAESARLDAFQAACLSARGQSYTGAVAALQGNPDRGPDCATQLEPVANTHDICSYPHAGGDPAVCQAWWSSRASDSDLCSGIGCWFGCEIRYGQDSSTVCMARFYSGEPCQYGWSGNCD